MQERRVVIKKPKGDGVGGSCKDIYTATCGMLQVAGRRPSPEELVPPARPLHIMTIFHHLARFWLHFWWAKFMANHSVFKTIIFFNHTSQAPSHIVPHFFLPSLLQHLGSFTTQMFYKKKQKALPEKLYRVLKHQTHTVHFWVSLIVICLKMSSFMMLVREREGRQYTLLCCLH